MIEDKLTHDERLRLECLAQASASMVGNGYSSSGDAIIDRARAFERYVTGSAR